MKSLLKNKFLLIVLVLALGVAVWFWFFRGSDVTEVTISATEQQTLQTEAEVNALLGRINSVNFSDSLFADRIYSSLRRFTRFLTSKPVGRTDPFDDYSRASGDRVTTSPIDPATIPAQPAEEESEESVQ